MALLARWHDDADLVANAPAITIDLAPAPVAPEITPTELPPGPAESQAQPEPVPEPVGEKPIEKTEIEPEPVPVTPVEKLNLKPEPAPQPELSLLPPPKPVEKPKEKETKKPRHTKQASLASAPRHAERRAERAAAQAPGAPSRGPSAVPNWKSRLVAQLERHKRYPSQAQSRGDQGVVELAFSVDRTGGVHHARIQRSSGSSLLDRATLALLARAAPLPPPPPEIRGAQIAIEVPIRYNLR